MKNLVILSFALAFAGCSTANVSGQSMGIPGGPNVSGGSVGFDFPGGSAAAVVVGVAALAALIGGWRDAPAGRDAPAMLEGRAINEVDCTRPIPDWSKNLKCR